MSTPVVVISMIDGIPTVTRKDEGVTLQIAYDDGDTETIEDFEEV